MVVIGNGLFFHFFFLGRTAARPDNCPIDVQLDGRRKTVGGPDTIL